MYERDDFAPALLSFLVGGILGASLTSLLAPPSGTVLRAGKVPEPGLSTDMGRGGRG